MKPETILNSDFLDILFDNRNKDYGAYPLRRQYNQRLLKAIITTITIAFLFTASLYVQAKFFKPNHIISMGESGPEVVLSELEDEKKPEKEIDKPKIKPAPPVRQVPNTSIVIVNDEEITNVPTNDQIDHAQIGLSNFEGVADSGVLTPPGPLDGVEGGKKIEPPKVEVKEPEEPLERAEVMPEFPGGMEALSRFMLRNLKEPEDLDEGEKVVVLVKFIVDKDGDIKINGILNGKSRFDDEVIRVINKMPRWKPGKQNGVNVPVFFTLPVTFAGTEQ